MTDPFSLFGLAPAFELDEAELAERHRELSRALHPDRHVGTASSQRRAALGKAIEVNQAHRLLRDPLSRAEALLALHGLSSETAGPAEQGLLLEIMELREALGEAGRRSRPEEVRALAEDVRQRAESAQQRLAAAFRGLGAGGNAEQVLAALVPLRYYRRFLDEADATLDELA
jgi:molecular chaperone HscB